MFLRADLACVGRGEQGKGGGVGARRQSEARIWYLRKVRRALARVGAVKKDGRGQRKTQCRVLSS